MTASLVTGKQEDWTVEASMAAVRSTLQPALASHLGMPVPRLLLLLKVLACCSPIVDCATFSVRA